MKIHTGCTPRMLRAIKALPEANKMLAKIRVGHDIVAHGRIQLGQSYCAPCDQWAYKEAGKCPHCRAPFDRPGRPMLRPAHQ